jgi:hypothetical protein
VERVKVEESASEAVWPFWWPIAALGGSMGIFAVLGVIGYQELFPRGSEARDVARVFSEMLERYGFITSVTEHDDFAVVDFYDPKLRSMLRDAGIPYDREKAATFSDMVIGSLEFMPAPGRRVLVSGDIPMTAMRKYGARGSWRETVAIPRGINVTELHWHTVDGLPAAHVHISGVDVSLKSLAEFVVALRNMSESFASVGGW